MWVGRLVLDEEPAILFWVGLALLTVALAAAGASLVTKGTWWLRLIVAVALPALVLSLYSGIRPMADSRHGRRRRRRRGDACSASASGSSRRVRVRSRGAHAR